MDLTRRAALALPALLAVGCSADSPAPEPAPVDPDVALVAAALVREQALLDAYAGLARSTPRLARLLGGLALDHSAHLTALGQVAPSPSPMGSAVPTPVVPVATSLAAVRGLLRSTERAHAAAVVDASHRLAPVLASLAACEASHLVLL